MAPEPLQDRIKKGDLAAFVDPALDPLLQAEPEAEWWREGMGKALDRLLFYCEWARRRWWRRAPDAPAPEDLAGRLQYVRAEHEKLASEPRWERAWKELPLGDEVVAVLSRHVS